jgi:hypothetical protein
MEVDSLYIIQLRESIRLGEDVYKIGKSKKMHTRIKQYPKGSKVIMLIEVDDCNICEKNVIKDFKMKFKQRRDLGTEYFEGNINEMIDYYKSICIKDITDIWCNSLKVRKVRKTRSPKEPENKEEILKTIKDEIDCEELDEMRAKDYIILKILLNDEEEEDYNMILSEKELKKIFLIKDMMMRMDIKMNDINVSIINKYENEVNKEDYEDSQEMISHLFRLGCVNSIKYKDYYFLLIKMIRNMSNLIDDIKRKYINKGNNKIHYYELKLEFKEYLKKNSMS